MYVCMYVRTYVRTIGLKTCATFSSNQKWNQNQSRLARTRFPALRVRHVITSSFDWFTGLSVSFVIG